MGLLKRNRVENWIEVEFRRRGTVYICSGCGYESDEPGDYCGGCGAVMSDEIIDEAEAFMLFDTLFGDHGLF